MSPHPVLHIRSATADDARAISELVLSLAPGLVTDARPEGQESFEADFSVNRISEYISSDRYRWFVSCCPDGRLVGVAALRDGTHLYTLFVQKEFQRRGIARGLWQRLQEAAAEAHATVQTVNAALAAVPVYERFGFAPTGERGDRLGVVYLPMRRHTGRP